MKVSVSDADRAFGRDVYRMFRAKAGSEFMASQDAITWMSALVHAVKPRRVLEYGAGIGTITYALLAHPHRVDELVATEPHDFCHQQLFLNIPGDLQPRMQVIKEPERFTDIEGPFDLVIFDGNFDDAAFENLGEGSVCFVEGNREHARVAARTNLAKRGLQCEFVKFPEDQASGFSMRWKKGLLGITYPKIRIGKPVKGGWIGRVKKAMG